MEVIVLQDKYWKMLGLFKMFRFCFFCNSKSKFSARFRMGFPLTLVQKNIFLMLAGQERAGKPCSAMCCAFHGKLKAWRKSILLNDNLFFALLYRKCHIYCSLQKQDFIAVTGHSEFNVHWGHHAAHKSESYKL